MLAWLTHRTGRFADYLRFAYVQRITGFAVSETPEFEPQCTPFFLQRLAQASSYLEFGSGGSTVLAARQGIPFIAVESDRFFLRTVRRTVEQLGLLDVERQFYLHADIGVTEAWGAPLFRGATPQRITRWRTYAEAPWTILAGLPGPHLILVDGRFRVACALMAAKFLRERPGEILIDDYAERNQYRAVERHLELRERAGRMALFAPRRDLDPAALDADIDSHFSDWR